MRRIHRIALILVIIGAINWGLIGFFRYDLVAAIFGGQASVTSRIIYSLVGLSGLVSIILLFDPMRKEERVVKRQGSGNLNYATEFAEETDLSKLKKD